VSETIRGEARFLKGAFDPEGRLVYADWLEENGDLDRAEILRARGILARADLRSRLRELVPSVDADWLEQVLPRDELTALRGRAVEPGPAHLPFLLIGTRAAEGEARAPARSPLVWTIEHQYGGYACSQASVTGLVLSLEPNAHHMRQDPWRVMWALRAVGEMPDAQDPAHRARIEGKGSQDDELTRLMQTTQELAGTWGEPYSRGELHVWARVLGGCLDFPPHLLRGHEALLEIMLEDPLRTFAGWSTTMFDEVDATDRWQLSRFSHNGGGLVVARPGPPVDAGMIELLGDRPSCFVLWPNSD
jgi:uncharacterized protein (TIGR02996 family)